MNEEAHILRRLLATMNHVVFLGTYVAAYPRPSSPVPGSKCMKLQQIMTSILYPTSSHLYLTSSPRIIDSLTSRKEEPKTPNSTYSTIFTHPTKRNPYFSIIKPLTLPTSSLLRPSPSPFPHPKDLCPHPIHPSTPETQIPAPPTPPPPIPQRLHHQHPQNPNPHPPHQ